MVDTAGDDPTLSIVIPTYNRCELLRETLEHLTRQHVAANEFEVIVADDGSSDGTPEVVAEFEHRLRLRYWFQPDEGFRAGTARNAGARLATSPVLVFLDTGPVPGPGFVSAHRAAHADPARRRAVVGSAYGYNPDQPMPELGAAVRAMPPLAVVEQYADDPGFRDVRHEVFDRCGADLTALRVPWQLFFTINCSVRRADFLAVGGFDESFHGWGAEDLELGLRLVRHGLTLQLAPDAWVIDTPHDRDLESEDRQLRINLRRFLKKCPEPVVELGVAVVDEGGFFEWEDEYRSLLAWQSQADESVADEIEATLRQARPEGAVAVFGAGGEVPRSLPPSTLLDFDPDVLERIRSDPGAGHTGHHLIGLRTPLADRAVDTVIVTSRLAGLWPRWGREILAEANRLGRTVRLSERAGELIRGPLVS